MNKLFIQKVLLILGLLLAIPCPLNALSEKFSSTCSTLLLKATSKLPAQLQNLITQKIKELPKKITEALFKKYTEEEKKEALKKL